MKRTLDFFLKATPLPLRFLTHKKGIVIIIITIVVFIIVALAKGGVESKYNTTKVMRSDIVEIVDEFGIVKISGQTDIYSPTTGIIEELYVSNGDYVEVGEELYKVRSTATEQETQIALANYLSAKTALDSAQSMELSLQADMFGKWDVFRTLATNDTYEDGNGNPKYDNRSLPEFHIAEKEWLAAESKYKSQKQAIAQAQALVASMWAQYQSTKNTVVTSTSPGVVSNLSVSQGDTVLLHTPNTVAKSKPIMIIADFSVKEVVLSLGENDITKVRANNRASITIESLGKKKFEGFVTRVDDVGHDDRGVVRYDVFVKLVSPDEGIRSGMSADVVITTSAARNVLSVPNSSVKSYKGGKAVQVVKKGGKLDFLPITIGKKGHKMTEVLTGLAEGQEVVTSLTDAQSTKSTLPGF